MKQRWFRLLVRTFPASVRSGRGEEILDVLRESNPSARQLINESASLLWASSSAWNRHLHARDGLWRSAYVGAVIWFGTLLAIGPMLRLRFTLMAGSSVPGSQVGPLPYVVAIAFCVLAVVLMPRSRWAAALVGSVGIAAAAASNVIGPWGAVESAIYETRWIGLALALIVVLAGRTGAHRPVPVWLPLSAIFATAGLVLALPLDAYTSHASRNYGMMVQWNLQPYAIDYFSQGLGQWVFLLLVIGAVLALFLHPTVSALVAAPALHVLTLGGDVDGIVPLVALVVAIAVLWRPFASRVVPALPWQRNEHTS